MALFSSAEEHAANPPETWQVVKVCERVWHLQTAGGVTLDRFKTRRDAEEARTQGFAFSLWHKLTRWHQGITPPGWKTYAQVCAERERNEQAQALFASFRAAGYERARIEDPGKRCSGGLEELPEGRPAWADADGWLWCRDHLATHLNDQAA